MSTIEARRREANKASMMRPSETARLLPFIPSRGLFPQLVQQRRYIINAEVKNIDYVDEIQIDTIPPIRTIYSVDNSIISSFFSNLSPQRYASYFLSAKECISAEWLYAVADNGIKVTYRPTLDVMMFETTLDDSTLTAMRINDCDAIGAVWNEDSSVPIQITIFIMSKIGDYTGALQKKHFVIEISHVEYPDPGPYVGVSCGVWSIQVCDDMLIFPLAMRELDGKNEGFLVLNLPAIIDSRTGDEDSETKITSSKIITGCDSSTTKTLEIKIGPKDSKYAKWWTVERALCPFYSATLIGFDYDDAIAGLFGPSVAEHLSLDVACEVIALLMRMPVLPPIFNQ